VAKRIQHRQQLRGFCVTQAQPPLAWLPAKPSAATDAQLAAAADGFEAWKQEQLVALEAGKVALEAAAAAKREGVLARLAARQSDEARGLVAPGDGDGDGEEGDEDEGDDDDDDAGDEGGAGGAAAAGAAAGAAGAAGNGHGALDDGGAEDDDQQQQQQQEEEEEAAAAEAAREERRRLRRAARALDDEDERLLSSDEDD
jgi:hypothetical protein